MTFVGIITLAVAFDLLLSDRIFSSVAGRAFAWPTFPWTHPVAVFGQLLTILERHVYPKSIPSYPPIPTSTPITLASPKSDTSDTRDTRDDTSDTSDTSDVQIHRRAFYAGVLYTLGAIGLAACVGIVIDVFAQEGSYGWVVQGLAAGTMLAGGALDRRVSEVAVALDHHSQEEAQRAVGHLVSRNVWRLDRHGIARSAIESVAENAADGFVTPMVFLVVGGILGWPCTSIFVFKAINTLDSMVGYKTRRYLWFGKTAARIDDVACYLGSRLTAIQFVIAASVLPGFKGWNALKIAWIWAPSHHSINGGWPIATMAGGLDVSLGGPRVYAEERVIDAWIGDGRREVVAGDIRRAIVLYRAALIQTILSAIVVTVWSHGLRFMPS